MDQQRRQNTGALLPHQRLYPIEPPISTQEPKDQTSQGNCKGQIGGGSLQQDEPTTRSRIANSSENTAKKISLLPSNQILDEKKSNEQTYQTSTPSQLRLVDSNIGQRQEFVRIKETGQSKLSQGSNVVRPSPELESGPGKGPVRSRWADPSRKGTPESKTSSPPPGAPSLAKVQKAVTKSSSPPSPIEPIGVMKPVFGDCVREPRGSCASESRNQDNSDLKVEKQTHQQKETVDEIPALMEWKKLFRMSVSQYMAAWIREAHVIQTNFLSKGVDKYKDCDIDTFEGVPMKPVDYPNTLTQKFVSRAQLKMTSTKWQEIMTAEFERRSVSAIVEPKLKIEPKATAEVTNSQSVSGTATLTEKPSNPNEVKIPCHLRPARGLDMGDIQAIYNQEIEDGYSVMDTKPVSIESFQAIYRQCLAENVPFVVAVEGWHGTEDTHEEVIGFALLTAVDRGIAGSHETLSSCGGRLLVIVKPEYRRNKIGTALIDVLMTSCSNRYTSKGGYQYVNPTESSITLRDRKRRRKWWYLDIDMMIRSAGNESRTRKGEEFQWIADFLELKFFLLLKNYDERRSFDPRRMIWLDKLTFRHTCRDPN
ncbi:hypothetical protein GGS21DRAFT_489179 [Xylaria nigripes]|nr:hypothetical protein GGS21DRAFT_489179 [Xylaria nigripes]